MRRLAARISASTNHSNSTPRSPWGFFPAAYLVSWVLWSPLVAAGLGWWDVMPPSWLHFAGAFGPALAALFVAARSGRSALRDLIMRIRRWRIGVGWLAVSLLSPAALFGASALTLRMIQGAWPSLSGFGTVAEFPTLAWPLAWLVWTFTFGIGEETGWRGSALHQLQHRWPAWKATLMVWGAWSLWHLPLFTYKDEYQGLGVGGTFAFFLTLLPGAIVLTWLYNSTQGSVLAVALWHGAWNTAIAGVADDMATTMSVLVILAAVVVVSLTGMRRLSSSPSFPRPLPRRTPHRRVPGHANVTRSSPTGTSTRSGDTTPKAIADQDRGTEDHSLEPTT